jgi:hypothetical protein
MRITPMLPNEDPNIHLQRQKAYFNTRRASHNVANLHDSHTRLLIQGHNINVLRMMVL